MIALFFAQKQFVSGGTASFALHLYAAMKMAEIDVRMYQFSDNPKGSKVLKGYGVRVHYATPEKALKIVRNNPSLLVSPEHEPLIKDLMKAGMRIVIHDPSEFVRKSHRNYEHLQDETLIKDPICIRPTLQAFYKDAHFIPHPYVRQFQEWVGGDLASRKIACSIARLTFVKRPEIILEANRHIHSDSEKIQLLGAENRLCTFHKLMPKFPEFKQGGRGLPLEWGASSRKAAEYMLAVDLTRFPHDGGGSQYTFMEAWDAGTVNVIHGDWLRYPGEIRADYNCLTIGSPEELAALIKETRNSKFIKKLSEISLQSTAHLEEFHNPISVAKAYRDELLGIRRYPRLPRFPRLP